MENASEVAAVKAEILKVQTAEDEDAEKSKSTEKVSEAEEMIQTPAVSGDLNQDISLPKSEETVSETLQEQSYEGSIKVSNDTDEIIEEKQETSAEHRIENTEDADMNSDASTTSQKIQGEETLIEKEDELSIECEEKENENPVEAKGEIINVTNDEEDEAVTETIVTTNEDTGISNQNSSMTNESEHGEGEIENQQDILEPGREQSIDDFPTENVHVNKNVEDRIEIAAEANAEDSQTNSQISNTTSDPKEEGNVIDNEDVSSATDTLDYKMDSEAPAVTGDLNQDISLPKSEETVSETLQDQSYEGSIKVSNDTDEIIEEKQETSAEHRIENAEDADMNSDASTASQKAQEGEIIIECEEKENENPVEAKGEIINVTNDEEDEAVTETIVTTNEDTGISNQNSSMTNESEHGEGKIENQQDIFEPGREQSIDDFPAENAYVNKNIEDKIEIAAETNAEDSQTNSQISNTTSDLKEEGNVIENKDVTDTLDYKVESEAPAVTGDLNQDISLPKSEETVSETLQEQSYEGSIKVSNDTDEIIEGKQETSAEHRIENAEDADMNSDASTASQKAHEGESIIENEEKENENSIEAKGEIFNVTNDEEDEAVTETIVTTNEDTGISNQNSSMTNESEHGEGKIENQQDIFEPGREQSIDDFPAENAYVNKNIEDNIEIAAETNAEDSRTNSQISNTTSDLKEGGSVIENEDVPSAACQENKKESSMETTNEISEVTSQDEQLIEKEEAYQEMEDYPPDQAMDDTVDKRRKNTENKENTLIGTNITSNEDVNISNQASNDLNNENSIIENVDESSKTSREQDHDCSLEGSDEITGDSKEEKETNEDFDNAKLVIENSAELYEPMVDEKGTENHAEIPVENVFPNKSNEDGEPRSKILEIESGESTKSFDDTDIRQDEISDCGSLFSINTTITTDEDIEVSTIATDENIEVYDDEAGSFREIKPNSKTVKAVKDHLENRNKKFEYSFVSEDYEKDLRLKNMLDKVLLPFEDGLYHIYSRYRCSKPLPGRSVSFAEIEQNNATLNFNEFNRMCLDFGIAHKKGLCKNQLKGIFRLYTTANESMSSLTFSQFKKCMVRCAYELLDKPPWNETHKDVESRVRTLFTRMYLLEENRAARNKKMKAFGGFQTGDGKPQGHDIKLAMPTDDVKRKMEMNKCTDYLIGYHDNGEIPSDSAFGNYKSFENSVQRPKRLRDRKHVSLNETSVDIENHFRLKPDAEASLLEEFGIFDSENNEIKNKFRSNWDNIDQIDVYSVFKNIIETDIGSTLMQDPETFDYLKPYDIIPTEKKLNQLGNQNIAEQAWKGHQTTGGSCPVSGSFPTRNKVAMNKVQPRIKVPEGTCNGLGFEHKRKKYQGIKPMPSRSSFGSNSTSPKLKRKENRSKHNANYSSKENNKKSNLEKASLHETSSDFSVDTGKSFTKRFQGIEAKAKRKKESTKYASSRNTQHYVAKKPQRECQIPASKREKRWNSSTLIERTTKLSAPVRGLNHKSRVVGMQHGEKRNYANVNSNFKDPYYFSSEVCPNEHHCRSCIAVRSRPVLHSAANNLNGGYVDSNHPIEAPMRPHRPWNNDRLTRNHRSHNENRSRYHNPLRDPNERNVCFTHSHECYEGESTHVAHQKSQTGSSITIRTVPNPTCYNYVIVQ